LVGGAEANQKGLGLIMPAMVVVRFLGIDEEADRAGIVRNVPRHKENRIFVCT
jgi:hypothetical protein